MTKPAIPGAYALLLLDLVGRWQITDAELLEGTALSRDRLAAPETRVSPLELRELVLRARELTGEPGLAVYMGLQMRLSSHGFLGFAAMTAPTVGAALSLAERYVATRLPGIGFAVHVEGGAASLVLEERAPLDADMREFLVLALFVGLAHVGDVIAGRPLTGGAEVTFGEPAYFARFVHMLPGTVRFGRPVNRLVFDRAVLELPLVMADPVAAELARAQCERELEGLGDGERMRAQVKELLQGGGGAGPLRSIEEVAHALHVSTRTLKRRLAAAGTTFSDVLDELRRERSLVLVDDRRLTIEEIAERLGYSDVANFTRAFRRWTGTTPAALRKSR